MMWDQQFEFMYYAEQRAQALTLLSSGMAILLACMGLFGLAAFTVEQRVKEIGVRKVLGASVPNLVFLVSRTFAIMVLIANLFAWPVAYFVMRSWLDGFAYRTDLSWWIFVLSWRGRIGDCVVYCEFPRPSRGAVQSGGSTAA
jgi:putative ABC transport system permease protein